MADPTPTPGSRGSFDSEPAKLLLFSRPRPRSASVGRPLRPASAAAGSGSGAPLVPTALPANEWGNASLTRDVSAQRRVSSATTRAPVAAWSAPRSATNPARSLALAPKALTAPARNPKPRTETLAELLATEAAASAKEQITRAQDQANLAQAEKRRLETELTALKANLEGLLHRDGGPKLSSGAAVQQRRYHEKTLAALTEQNEKLVKERDLQAQQIVGLQKSTRATRLVQLEAELQTAKDEIKRLQEAQQSKASSAAHAPEAWAAPGSGIAAQAPVDLSSIKAFANSSSISSSGVRRGLQAMLQAHKILMSHASLIRAALPEGLNLHEFRERSRHKAATAGAPDVLNFLRNHAIRLAGELQGFPGASLPSVNPQDMTDLSASASGGVGGRGGSPQRLGSSDLVAVVSSLAQRLRATEEQAFRTNAELMTSTIAATDVMAICISEVQRLQGLAPSQPRDSPRKDTTQLPTKAAPAAAFEIYVPAATPKTHAPAAAVAAAHAEVPDAFVETEAPAADEPEVPATIVHTHAPAAAAAAAHAEVPAARVHTHVPAAAVAAAHAEVPDAFIEDDEPAAASTKVVAAMIETDEPAAAHVEMPAARVHTHVPAAADAAAHAEEPAAIVHTHAPAAAVAAAHTEVPAARVHTHAPAAAVAAAYAEAPDAFIEDDEPPAARTKVPAAMIETDEPAAAHTEVPAARVHTHVPAAAVAAAHAEVPAATVHTRAPAAAVAAAHADMPDASVEDDAPAAAAAAMEDDDAPLRSTSGPRTTERPHPTTVTTDIDEGAAFDGDVDLPLNGRGRQASDSALLQDESNNEEDA